jgi:hypothetical protein
MVRAFDRLPAIEETGILSPELAARRCLARGLAELVHSFAEDRPEGAPRLSLKSGTSLHKTLGIPCDANPDVFDPLPLVRAISGMQTGERAQLWRSLAAERKTHRSLKAGGRAVANEVEELLAQVDFIRGEIESVQKRLRRR